MRLEFRLGNDPETAPEGQSSAAEQFLLAEYSRLSNEFARSKQSAENAARFFTVIVGATVAGAVAIAGFAEEWSPLEAPAIFQVGGGIALLLAVVGVLSSTYIAHERGWRVEILNHLGSIRDYFVESWPKVGRHLTLARRPTFFRGWFSGDAMAYYTLAVLTTALLLVGVYLLVEAEGLATAFREDLRGPYPSPYLLTLLPLVSLLVHCVVFYLVMRDWEAKWKLQKCSAERRARALLAQDSGGAVDAVLD